MNESKINTAELLCITDRVRSAWRNIIPRQNLTRSQFGTLFGIYRKGAAAGGYSVTDAVPVTLTELAASLWQSLPALSQRVFMLEKLGYVQRLPNQNDRRAIGLKLTEEGLRVTEEAKNRFNDILERTFEKLGADAETLITLLSELAEAFEKVSEQEKEAGGKK